MPTYEYQCRSCDHEFELFQQMSDPVKRKCPACNQLQLERLIGTGAGVLFKGSGFYETDYRSSSYKKAAQAEKSAAAGTNGTSDKKKKSSEKATSNGQKKTKAKAGSAA